MATICEPAFTPELQDVPRTDAEETVRRGSRLLSSKVGLIRRMRSGIHRAQDPELFTVVAEVADFSRYSEFPRMPNGGGTGETLEVAIAAAIGECVERYCVLFGEKLLPPARELRDAAGVAECPMVLATYREVAEHAVSPDLARLYSREQIEQLGAGSPFSYFTDETKVRWIWGYSLTGERPRLVPASRVLFSIHPGEQLIGQANTTGLAAGGTLEEAILSGLLEVIERDAVIISWLRRRIGRRLEIDDPPLQEMLSRRFFVDHPSVDLRCFDLRLDLPIPVVMAVMRRPTDFGPCISVTAAARLDPRAAVRKALYEQGQFFPFIRNVVRSSWQPEPDFSNVVDFERHSLLYLRRPELIPEAFAFCDGVQSVALSEVPDLSTGRVLGDLEVCVEALRAIGLEVVVIELTTPDILEVGLWVVRVVVPGLAMLHGDNLPYLGVRRLHEPPDRLVWPDSGWDPDAGLNPYPHPIA